jgi:hypothetical protein
LNRLFPIAAFLFVVLGAAVVCGASPPQPLSNVRTGTAKFYSPGVFERVLKVRGMSWPRGVSGLASTPYCANIGKRVRASINGGPWRTYLIADCSRHGADQKRHLRTGLVLEVDYRSAVREGFHKAGKAPAKVVYP